MGFLRVSCTQEPPVEEEGTKSENMSVNGLTSLMVMLYLSGVGATEDLEDREWSMREFHEAMKVVEASVK